MSEAAWIWDDCREMYYYWEPYKRCYIFQDESIVYPEGTSPRNGSASRNVEIFPPLGHNKHRIRLLSIVRDTSKQIISCQLTPFDLEHCPSFIALSYRWGSPQAKNKQILLQGELFDIRRNLYDFLSAERTNPSSSSTKLYWIDALCIDQANKKEKNHQVPLMGTIYFKAETVVIWIPPSMQVFDDPYWTRIWIVQEILFAFKIVIRNGSEWYSWEEIKKMAAIQPAEANCGYFHGYASNIIELKSRFRTDNPNFEEDFDLYRLIWTFQNWASTDPRDKVFALCNLASEKTRMTVDYKMSLDSLLDKVNKLAMTSSTTGFVKGMAPLVLQKALGIVE